MKLVRVLVALVAVAVVIAGPHEVLADPIDDICRSIDQPPVTVLTHSPEADEECAAKPRTNCPPTIVIGLASTGTTVRWHPQIKCHGYIRQNETVFTQFVWQVSVSDSTGFSDTWEGRGDRSFSWTEKIKGAGDGSYACNMTPGVVTSANASGAVWNDFGSHSINEGPVFCN
jgi:hypothetical protein